MVKVPGTYFPSRFQEKFDGKSEWYLLPTFSRDCLEHKKVGDAEGGQGCLFSHVEHFLKQAAEAGPTGFDVVVTPEETLVVDETHGQRAKKSDQGAFTVSAYMGGEVVAQRIR